MASICGHPLGDKGMGRGLVQAFRWEGGNFSAKTFECDPETLESSV